MGMLWKEIQFSFPNAALKRIFKENCLQEDFSIAAKARRSEPPGPGSLEMPQHAGFSFVTGRSYWDTKRTGTRPINK